MSDIQYWDDTLTEEIEAIQAMIDKIPNINQMAEKLAAIDRVKDRMRGAAGTKRSFKMEIRLVQDVNLRRKYESRLAGLDNQLNAFQADLKAIEAETSRGELFAGGAGEVDPERSQVAGEKAGDDLLKQAGVLQDRTQDSLSNTKRLIEESKEVGIATLEELERQREVIMNIDREVDRIDDNLARAEELMKQFGRRMASDHFIQCFAGLNCMLLLGVVVFAIVKKGSVTGAPPPPSPT